LVRTHFLYRDFADDVALLAKLLELLVPAHEMMASENFAADYTCYHRRQIVYTKYGKQVTSSYWPTVLYRTLMVYSTLQVLLILDEHFFSAFSDTVHKSTNQTNDIIHIYSCIIHNLWQAAAQQAFHQQCVCVLVLYTLNKTPISDLNT